MTEPLALAALANVRSILSLAIEHAPDRRALLLFDRGSPLSSLLGAAYREALPDAAALELPAGADEARGRIDRLAAGDLVVLVESVRFFPEEHRFRVRLFDRGLKVVEHPHLARIAPGEEPAYVDALAYDPGYYRPLGAALKRRLDRAAAVRLSGGGAALEYRGGFEEARLNVGDYSGQRNVGGQFPIGEVFTEPRDLSAVDGEVLLFAFGDAEFGVAAADRPFPVRVERGLVTGAPGAPPAFGAILEAIRAGEEVVRVRELGLGLNRAFTRERRVSDVGSYERMNGVHLSLGSKHAIFAKAGIPKRRAKFHVDVFAAVERVEIDGVNVWSDGFFDPDDAGSRGGVPA